MIVGDIYFEGYYPPEQMRPDEYEDIYFYVENIGDEAGDIWVDHYRNGILIKDSIEVLLPSGRVRLFTPGYVVQGEGQVEYEIRVGHFTNYPSGKTQDGLLYFVIEEEILACSDYTNQTECEDVGCYWYDGGCHTNPLGQITCYRCRSVGNGYSVPESQIFDGNTCPEGWFEIQPPCNLPPECSDYTTQIECTAVGCYWWDNECHTNEKPSPDLLPYIAIGGIVFVIIATIIIKKR